jgi:hypothetical protein
MKRSAIAFARGAGRGCGGWRCRRRQIRVEGGGELGISVADQEPELLGAVTEVHQQQPVG